MEDLRCEIIWKNLCLKTKKGKTILKNVSGRISPGTFAAILGPSGSGKTTLLNCIAGRISNDLILSGSIKVNKCDRDKNIWPNIISYVGQSFPADEKQTVYETLMFVASIKLKDQNKIEDTVNDFIRLLGLELSRNTFLDRLSGGERVRVSLGIELMGNPPVVLLDEPVSGLDSFNAQNILSIGRSIADMGKTVLITIHQPSYKMAQYFDKIILMCSGSPVFDGKIDDCISFFDDCGFKLPENTNPTDFFLDVLAINTSTDETIRESYEKTDQIKKKWNDIKPDHEFETTDRITLHKERRGIFVLMMLLKRVILDYKRDKPYVIGKAFQRIFIGIIFSLTFLQTGVIGANIFSFRGILSLYSQTELFGVTSPIFNQFHSKKMFISRERKSGFYTGYEAYISHLIVEYLSTIFFSIPYIIATYYIIGLDSNFGTAIKFVLILMSLDAFSVAYGLTISTAAPTIEAAQVIGISINVVFILYSGILGNTDEIPSWLEWLKWLSPLFYIFTALCKNQLLNTNGTASESQNANTITGASSLEGFGLNSLNVTANVFVVLGYAVLMSIIGSITLHYKTINNLKLKNTEEDV